ncbi:hypothetical protein M427DRAFT_307405 [Gonapodya prolifera JEL478]|uniref:SH3 domain-containing protein n=1 Tax=Gonapodya prolifera (strain JEL478) TaxID=1344416 RepID=A0A139AGY5_GONPJ|nr:hypothetical protein M427DRAFT_307405 [Gonapodya prolifera JEL478]|eukprot:KXS16008.1 hypothetical protein M427DRAFT_307405 [Gonapodya prolifera JEL478]
MSQQTLQPGNLWGGELTPSTAQPLKDGQAQQRNASPTPQNAARPTSPNASASGVWGGQPTTNYTANLPNGSSNGTNPGHASRPSQGATPDLAKAQMQFAETLKKQELESRLRQQAAAAQGGTPAPQNQNSQPPNGYHSPPLGGSQTELNKHNKTNSTGAPPPTQPGFEYRNPKSQRLTSRVVGPVMPPPQPAAPPPPTSSPPPPPTTAPPPTPAPQTTAAPRILVVTVAYRPQNPDELELKQGERLREDRWFDDGWSFGTNLLTGKSGFFPQEFVVSAPTPPPPSATSGAGARAAAQELKASGIAAMGPSPPKTNGQQQPQPPLAAGAPPVPPKAGPGPVPTGPPAVGGLTGGFGGGGGASNVPVSVRLGSKQVPVPAPAAPEKQAAAPSAPLFQCVMAYKAAQSDELDLRVGDRVREDKRYDDGWSYGTNLESGKRGFYPQEFFAPFGGNSQAAPAKPQPSTYPPPLPPVNTSAGNGPGPTSPQYDGQSLVESAPYRIVAVPKSCHSSRIAASPSRSPFKLVHQRHPNRRKRRGVLGGSSTSGGKANRALRERWNWKVVP